MTGDEVVHTWSWGVTSDGGCTHLVMGCVTGDQVVHTWSWGV